MTKASAFTVKCVMYHPKEHCVLLRRRMSPIENGVADKEVPTVQSELTLTLPDILSRLQHVAPIRRQAQFV